MRNGGLGGGRVCWMVVDWKRDEASRSDVNRSEYEVIKIVGAAQLDVVQGVRWLRSGPQRSIQYSEQTTNIVPVSVNYFPHRKCNYACEFCFHTTKNLYILPLDQAKHGLRLLADAGMKKLNISGGEPFLKPDYIGELFRYSKEELHLESCSVVCNGSKVTEMWLDKYSQYLDIMAISCDSFDEETNLNLGRSEKGRGVHVNRVFQVADWCRARGIRLKINSVITRLNFEEDMNESIEALSPYRWKVFQVLLLNGENTGSHTGSLRDARNLTITLDEFQSFLARHAHQKSLVPEDNQTMRDSYLNLDEQLRFLNSSDGGKVPGRSILDVGVQEALKDAGFNQKSFIDRGGIFEWSRDQNALDW